MAFRRNYKKSYKKSYKKAYKKKTTTTKKLWSTPLKIMVKRLIERRLEDKIAVYEIADNEPICSIAQASGELTISNNVFSPLDMFNSITQGPGQEQRIGNDITIKKWSLNGVIRFQAETIPADLIPQTYFIYMYVLRRKDYQAVNEDPDDLFQNGSQTQGATSTILDDTLYINKDSYTVLHKRKFKIGSAFPIDASGNYRGLAANDNKTLFSFRIPLTKHFKNCVVKYNDGTPQPMTGKINIYVLWGIAGANFESLYTTDQAEDAFNFVSFTMNSNMVYTDA